MVFWLYFILCFFTAKTNADRLEQQNSTDDMESSNQNDYEHFLILLDTFVHWQFTPTPKKSRERERERAKMPTNCAHSNFGVCSISFTLSINFVFFSLLLFVSSFCFANHQIPMKIPHEIRYVSFCGEAFKWKSGETSDNKQ